MEVYNKVGPLAYKAISEDWTPSEIDDMKHKLELEEWSEFRGAVYNHLFKKNVNETNKLKEEVQVLKEQIERLEYNHLAHLQQDILDIKKEVARLKQL